MPTLSEEIGHLFTYEDLKHLFVQELQHDVMKLKEITTDPDLIPEHVMQGITTGKQLLDQLEKQGTLHWYNVGILWSIADELGNVGISSCLLTANIETK